MSSSPSDFSYVGNVEALATALSKTQDAVYLLDPISGQPLFATHSLLHLLDYTPEEITTFSDTWPDELIHPDDRPYLNQHIRGFASLHPGARSRVVFRVKDKQDKWHCVESRGIVLTGSDTPIVIGVSRLLDHAHDEIDHSKHHDHRCSNCNKLLGKAKPEREMVEVKCSRCGEYNHLDIH